LLRNLVIENNRANRGGGISLSGSTSMLENCIVQNNIAELRGAGIFISALSNTVLRNCTIRENIIEDGTNNYGAGIAVGAATSVLIANCYIQDNRALGIKPSGTGIYVTNTEYIEIVNTVFSGNYSVDTLNQSTIDLNNSNAIIKHCTSYNNSGGICLYYATLKIYNSIFVDNAEEEIHFGIIPESNRLEVSYSLIDGDYDGIGNITGDPGFVDDALLVPNSESICLGKGSSAYSLDTDITGSERPIPMGSRPDLGAYELEQNVRLALVQFFDDINQNGERDSNELFIGAGSILHNNLDSYKNLSPEGLYVELDAGENTIQYDPSNAGLWTISTGPDIYTINANSSSFFETLEIGIRPTRELRKLVNTIYAPNLVCNTTVTIEVAVKNEGTTTESGLLWLEMDEKFDIVSVLVEPDEEEENRMAWAFDNLVPGESMQRKVKIQVPSIVQVDQDEELYLLSQVEIDNIGGYVRDFVLTDVVRCAYDPNDKLVNPLRDDKLALIEDDLVYTIRFQNVGNYHAEDVLVTDTIDSEFDMTSFQFLHSSHTDRLRLSIEDHILHFSFEDIFLPDSTTNFEASNGYIMYSINADTTVLENTLVENTAHIYFDFNEAVVTNTTETKFFFSKQIDLLTVFDARGKQILQKQNVQELDLDTYLPGIYFAKLHQGEKHAFINLILTN